MMGLCHLLVLGDQILTTSVAFDREKISTRQMAERCRNFGCKKMNRLRRWQNQKLFYEISQNQHSIRNTSKNSNSTNDPYEKFSNAFSELIYWLTNVDVLIIQFSFGIICRKKSFYDQPKVWENCFFIRRNWYRRRSKWVENVNRRLVDVNHSYIIFKGRRAPNGENKISDLTLYFFQNAEFPTILRPKCLMSCWKKCQGY